MQSDSYALAKANEVFGHRPEERLTEAFIAALLVLAAAAVLVHCS